MTCVKLVLPSKHAGAVSGAGSWDEKNVKEDWVGEAGGDGGQGGGVCFHVTDTGRLLSEGEKEMDSTFVCSYTEAPTDRA